MTDTMTMMGLLPETKPIPTREDRIAAMRRSDGTLGEHSVDIATGEYVEDKDVMDIADEFIARSNAQNASAEYARETVTLLCGEIVALRANREWWKAQAERRNG